MSAPDVRKNIPLHERDPLTPNEAASLCYLSAAKVRKLFDADKIKGFLVPESGFRRIPRSNLYAFMIENGIPLDRIDPNINQIGLLVSDELFKVFQSTAANFNNPKKLRRFDSGLDMGMQHKSIPNFLAVEDTGISDTELKSIGKFLQTLREEKKREITSLGVFHRQHTTVSGQFSMSKDVQTGYEEIVQEFWKVANPEQD